MAAIHLSTCCVIYSSLVLAYAGQASFLRKNKDAVADVFFKSIPVAVLAATIASQALITGTFLTVHQSLSLGCFPRVKVVHTSTKYPGQVYIPEVNHFLMLAGILVTLVFSNTQQIGHAYGIAVVFVMTLTSSFRVLVMLMIWKIHMVLIIMYVLVIGVVEIVYLSAVHYKINEGGYLHLAFSAILMFIMFTWNHVHRKRYFYELQHKISPEKLKEIIVMETNKSPRLPGLAIFYSELAHGIPLIFKHYLANVPALHNVLIFVSFKSLPISKIPVEERFLFRRVQPRNLQVFHCVVRYGYNDVKNEEEEFEKVLVEKLKQFIIRKEEQSDEYDVEEMEHAYEHGVVHLVGEHDVVAKEGSNWGKRLVINHAYRFLRRNLRQSKELFDIPHKRMLKVGMIYDL